MKQRDSVAVLGKALDVLECLVDTPNQTVTEISTQAGVTKAAAYRILATFENRGYVVSYERVRRYSIGPAFHLYLPAARNADRLLEAARPAMVGLWETLGETVNLGVLARGGVLYLDVLESVQGLRATTDVGAFDSLHSTALGKAIMSRMPDEARETLLADVELVKRTARTVTDLTALRDSIARATEDGMAIDDEENEIGMRCVAAPIVNADGWPLAAISVSGPSSRMSHEAINTIGARLIAACARISATLVHRAAR